MSLLNALRDPKQFSLHVEMCPPRVDLPLEQSVEAWIDSNRLMRKITSRGQLVFLTDGAIGRREEPNLRHLFFQAEDGIRRGHVTGVQTCALPIFRERIRDMVAEFLGRSVTSARSSSRRTSPSS